MQDNLDKGGSLLNKVTTSLKKFNTARNTLNRSGVRGGKRQAEDLSLTSTTPSKKAKGVTVHYETTYDDRNRSFQRGQDWRNRDRSSHNEDRRDYIPRGGRGGRGGRDGRNHGGGYGSGNRGNDCPQLSLVLSLLHI